MKVLHIQMYWILWHYIKIRKLHYNLHIHIKIIIIIININIYIYMTSCKCISKINTCTPCKCKTQKYFCVSIGVKPCTCLNDHLHLHTQHWVILTTTWASSSNCEVFYKNTKHSKKILVYFWRHFIYIYIYIHDIV